MLFAPEEHQFLFFFFFIFFLISLFYFGWSTDNSELLNLFFYFIFFLVVNWDIGPASTPGFIFLSADVTLVRFLVLWNLRLYGECVVFFLFLFFFLFFFFRFHWAETMNSFVTLAYSFLVVCVCMVSVWRVRACNVSARARTRLSLWVWLAIGACVVSCARGQLSRCCCSSFSVLVEERSSIAWKTKTLCCRRLLGRRRLCALVDCLEKTLCSRRCVHHRSIPDLPTDDGIERRNVLKSLPSIPTDIYYQSNRIYCVVSIVCCVYHVCRK